MHLLEVHPPVPGVILDSDLQRGRHSLYLQLPDLYAGVALENLLWFKSHPFAFSTSASLLEIRIYISRKYFSIFN